MSLHILIFSDNGSFNDYLCQLLASAGHAPVQAAPGVEPFRAVRHEKPDLIIIAVEADKVAALAVEQRLQTETGPRPVPVIVISDCLRLETELLHLFDFIPKPLDVQRLFEDLAALRERAGSRRAPAALTDSEYESISSHILSCTGLHFESRNRSGLERGIRKRMSALLIDSCGEYFAFLKRHGESRQELQKLVQFLTVGETYFFRYPSQYEALQESLLARHHLAAEPIRIWSAGCSTGEEAYSIAMTVMETFPDWRSRDIRIIATDINHQSLKQAREAVYGQWSIRSTGPRYLERYFNRCGECFILRTEVKRLVTFYPMNLSAPCSGDFCSELHDLDAIFCRNVLIYFTPEQAAKILQKLAGALKPSGELFLGHAETMLQRPTELEARNRENCFYYVRRPSAQSAGEAEAGPRQSVVSRAALEPRRAPLLRTVPGPELDSAGTAAPLQEARALFDSERFDAALESVEKLLGRSQEDPAALILKGFVLASLGRLCDSFETCSRAIAKNDLIPDAYFLKGILLDVCGLLDEAADEYRKALLLDHDFIMPRYYMGRLHMRLGRVPEAAREIRNSITLLARRRGEETVPYSGGLTSSACLLKLQDALAQVA